MQETMQKEYLHSFVLLIANEEKLGDAIKEPKYAKAYQKAIDEAEKELKEAIFDAVNTCLIKNNDNGKKQLKRRAEIVHKHLPAVYKAFKNRDLDGVTEEILKVGQESNSYWLNEYLPAERTQNE